MEDANAALEQLPWFIVQQFWLHSPPGSHLPHGPLQIIDLLALMADHDAIMSTITFYLNLFSFTVQSPESLHG